MEIISFIGIVAALILIILGSVRGYSLILLSTVAALLVAATGGVNVFENYANVYMGGVANMVLALFPIFLGGDPVHRHRQGRRQLPGADAVRQPVH